VEHSNACFNQTCGWLRYTLTFGNHWSTQLSEPLFLNIVQCCITSPLLIFSCSLPLKWNHAANYLRKAEGRNYLEQGFLHHLWLLNSLDSKCIGRVTFFLLTLVCKRLQLVLIELMDEWMTADILDLISKTKVKARFCRVRKDLLIFPLLSFKFSKGRVPYQFIMSDIRRNRIQHTGKKSPNPAILIPAFSPFYFSLNLPYNKTLEHLLYFHNYFPKFSTGTIVHLLLP
jgi:hypothetical protein